MINKIFSTKRKTIWFTIGFIFINLILKTLFLHQETLYGDEPFSLFFSQQRIPEIIQVLSEDLNPPFYFILLHFWIKIFGVSLFFSKFLSVLFSSLTAGMIFLFAKRFLNFNTAIIGAVIFTLSNVHIHFSHEIRCFALITFLCVSSFYLFLKLLEKPKFLTLLFLSMVNALLVYTHFLTVYIHVAQFLFFLFIFSSLSSKTRWYYLVSQILAVLLFFPWLHFLYLNIPESGDFWMETPKLKQLYYVLYKLSGSPILLVYFFTSIILLGLGYFSKNRNLYSESSIKIVLLLFWLLVPIIGNFIVAQFTPVFILRYVLYASIGLFLLTAYLLTASHLNAVYKVLFASIIIGTQLISLNLKPQKSENWRKIMHGILDERNENTAVIIQAWYKHRAFTFYFNKDYFKNYKNTTDLLKQDHIFCTNSAKGFNIDDIKEKIKVILVQCHEEVSDKNGTMEELIYDQGYCLDTLIKEKGVQAKVFFKSYPGHY